MSNPKYTFNKSDYNVLLSEMLVFHKLFFSRILLACKISCNNSLSHPRFRSYITPAVVFTQLRSMIPTWLFIGSVLIWHMYSPPSSSCTLSIWRLQVFKLVWLTLTLGLCVMTWLWIAWMALVSDLIHPTCADGYMSTGLFVMLVESRRPSAAVVDHPQRAAETRQMKYQYSRSTILKNLTPQ